MTPTTEAARPPCETEEVEPTVEYTIPQQAISIPAKRTARLSWDQFLLGQVPFIIAVALIIGVMALLTARALPAGASLPGRQGEALAAAPGGAITAFVAETAAQQVPVAADPTGVPKWDKATYEAQAGDVTFVVTNGSPVTHNFAVEGPGVLAQSPNFAGKTTNSFTLKGLKPGEYLIVCTFAGHREGGMVAKLIVK